MPRDSNGNYTLPSGNPVVTGEVISTGWANPTMSDIGAEITNSLDRQGRGGMLAPFKFVDGTNSQPGMTWTNEPTTGFYRAGGADMRATVAGVSRMRWTGTGCDVYDTVAGTWVALANSSGVNFAGLNAANKFTQSQVIVNTTASWQLWKDSTPSLGARLAFNINVADGLEVAYFNGTAWRPKFAANNANSYYDNDNHVFRTADLSIAMATFNASGLEILSGYRATIYNGDNSRGLQLVSIGVDAYLAGTVDSVQFQLASANRFGVNASGISTYAGGQTRFYSADNSRFGAIYNSNGVLIFDTLQPMGTDAMKFQMGGVDWFTMTGSVANFYNAMPLRFYQADNTSYGEIKNTNGILSLNSPALGFDVNSVRYLDMSDGGINVYDGRAIRYYGPGNAGTLAISKPSSGYSSIDELGGLPIIFYSGSIEKFRIASDAVSVRDYVPLRLYNSGSTTYTELQFTSDNGATNQMRVAARGAAWHWNSTALVAGDVTIQTTDPAATGGRFGQIVLVYE